DGKISVGDSTISLRDLRTCGFLGRRSQGYTFTVTKSKKGQIRIADITIHFGYFTPSTQQVLGEPRLADAVTSGGFLDPDQKVFTGFLVGSLLLAGAYGYLSTFAVHDPTAALDNLPPSLEKLLVSEDAAPLNIGDAGGEGDADVVEEIAVEATSEGTGTGGGGGGSSDVVSEGQAMGSGAAEFAIASIMSNVVGGAGGSTGIAMGAGTAALMSTGVGTVGAGGGGAGAGGTGEGDGFASAAGGGGGGISRTEAGSGGGPTVTKARAVAPTASVSSSSSDVSSDAISKISNYIRARGGQIKRIYERYLADNPMLAGRVVVNVTFTNGSVSSASIAGNTTGNGALANEILSTVRGWSIGGIEGTVSLSVPFVLQPF
ncbi:AgmX/PglI C-terminal domain-containing protein, partial [bacterium]|nr:AgmX/PglI C-terminal domain-containing protein [bacterium]